MELIEHANVNMNVLENDKKIPVWNVVPSQMLSVDFSMVETKKTTEQDIMVGFYLLVLAVKMRNTHRHNTFALHNPPSIV